MFHIYAILTTKFTNSLYKILDAIQKFYKDQTSDNIIDSKERLLRNITILLQEDQANSDCLRYVFFEK